MSIQGLANIVHSSWQPQLWTKKSALSIFFGFKGKILVISWFENSFFFKYDTNLLFDFFISYKFLSKFFRSIFKIYFYFLRFLFTLAKLKLKVPKDICFKSKHQVEIWVAPETEIEHTSPECFFPELSKWFICFGSQTLQQYKVFNQN